MRVLQRKIEINGQEFTVFGKAPWTHITVPKTQKVAECVIIVEGRLVNMLFNGDKYYNPHRFNALSRMGQKGALLPVVFTGESGRAMAMEITKKLNDKLDK